MDIWQQTELSETPPSNEKITIRFISSMILPTFFVEHNLNIAALLKRGFAQYDCRCAA
jgi:hypothetical protein